MIKCIVNFNETKCRITVIYECIEKNTTNILYSQVSARSNFELYYNFKEAEKILLDWTVHEFEIDALWNEILDCEKLNGFKCGFAKMFNLIS